MSKPPSQPPGQPPGSGEEYAQHVQAILGRVAELEARVEEQKKAAARGPLLTQVPVVGLVALVFGAVVTWNYLSLTREVEPLPPGTRETSLQVSVMVMTAAVEAYREEHGALPESLEDMGVPPGLGDALEYRPRGSEFDLLGSMGGTAVRYRSEDGPASLLQQMPTGAVPPPGGGPP